MKRISYFYLLLCMGVCTAEDGYSIFLVQTNSFNLSANQKIVVTESYSKKEATNIGRETFYPDVLDCTVVFTQDDPRVETTNRFSITVGPSWWSPSSIPRARPSSFILDYARIDNTILLAGFQRGTVHLIEFNPLLDEQNFRVMVSYFGDKDPLEKFYISPGCVFDANLKLDLANPSGPGVILSRIKMKDAPVLRRGFSSDFHDYVPDQPIVIKAWGGLPPGKKNPWK